MFQGPSEISLDTKGRLAIPTRYRDDLRSQGDGKIVISPHPHGCLLLYPKEAWVPIRARIMQLSGFDRRVGLLQDLLVGCADDVEMDAAGRVLIAPLLRRHATIERDVVMLGQGHHFKIWDIGVWGKRFEEIRNLGPDMVPAGMEDLVL